MAILPAAAASRVLLCGGPQVILGSVQQEGAKVTFMPEWTWRPEESAGLPAALMRKFITTDDCKPVSDGKEVLITSSGDAVALVSRETGGTLFYAQVKNAHSAALLPGGLIAVASSDSPDGAGDRVLVFDRAQSNKIQAEIPLEAAHGVEWDRKREVLWALGANQLLRIAVRKSAGSTVSLAVLFSAPLPKPIGHDLQLAPDLSVLYVSNTKDVWTFSPEAQSFSHFPPLIGRPDIKSLSVNRETGQIAFTQAAPGVWWTYTLHLVNPAGEIRLDAPIYKARWYTME